MRQSGYGLLKRAAILAALGGMIASAQPVLVGSPYVDNITSSQARVHWLTDIASTTVIEYGITPALGSMIWPNWGNLFSIHNWFVSGIAPSTTVYYRGCSAPETYSGWSIVSNTITITGHGFTDGMLVQMNTGNGGRLYSLRNYGTYFVVNATANTFQLAATLGGTPVTVTGTVSGTTKVGRAVCTAVSTFTTTAGDPSGLAAPIPPATSVPDVPVIDGTTLTVDSTCSNLPTILTTLSGLTGSANHQVVIPAGTDCRGPWVFPARPSHTGWVVIRTAAPDSQIPPPGVRSREEFIPYYAKFTSDAFPVMNWIGATSMPLFPCTGKGQLDATTSPSVNGTGLTTLYVCDVPNQIVTKNIETITNTAGVITIKITGHGFKVGTLMRVEGTGISALDSKGYPILVIDSDNFQLVGTSGTITSCTTCTGLVRADTGRIMAPGSTYGPTANRPATCADGQTWIDEVPANPSSISWCDNGTWRQFRMVNQPGSNSLISFQAGARMYRFIGLDIQHAKFPQTIPDGWGTGDQKQGRMGGLIRTRISNSDIVFDRCEIHSHDYPNRTSTLVVPNGTRIGLVNSRIYNGVSWVVHPASGLLEVNMIQIVQGNGGFLQNNYIQGVGISLIMSDSSQQSASEPASPDIPLQFVQAPSDFIIRRNLFYKDPIHLAGTPANYLTGRTYVNRHHMEFKRGQRFLVDGNIFDNNWSKAVQGATMLLTPVNPDSTWVSSPVISINTTGDVLVSTSTLDNAVPGEPMAITGASNPAHNGIWTIVSITPSTNTIRLSGMPAVSSTGGTATALGATVVVTDLDWTNNTMSRTPVATLLNGHGVQAGPITKQTQRIRFRNNLFFDINRRACTDGVVDYRVCDATAGPPYGYNDPTGISPTGGSPYIFSVTYGPEDYILDNNSAIDVQGSTTGVSQMLFNTDLQNGTGKGLSMKNNLWISTGSGSSIVINGQTWGVGSDGLDAAWPNLGGPSVGWASSNNAFCCNVSSSTKYSTIAALPTSKSAFSFWNDTLLNYRLRWDSPFISGGANRGSDGRDVGADIDALEAAQGKVQNARSWGVSSTTATVAYLAPDSDSCTVEYGTSPTWGVGSRLSDGGGVRVRNVALSALTPNTTYYYRVLCAVEQPAGSFRTAP